MSLMELSDTEHVDIDMSDEQDGMEIEPKKELTDEDSEMEEEFHNDVEIVDKDVEFLDRIDDDDEQNMTIVQEETSPTKAQNDLDDNIKDVLSNVNENSQQAETQVDSISDEELEYEEPQDEEPASNASVETETQQENDDEKAETDDRAVEVSEVAEKGPDDSTSAAVVELENEEANDQKVPDEDTKNERENDKELAIAEAEVTAKVEEDDGEENIDNVDELHNNETDENNEISKTRELEPSSDRTLVDDDTRTVEVENQDVTIDKSKNMAADGNEKSTDSNVEEVDETNSQDGGLFSRFRISLNCQGIEYYLYPLEEDDSEDDIFVFHDVLDEGLTIERLFQNLREAFAFTGESFINVSENDLMELRFDVLKLTLKEKESFSSKLTMGEICHLFWGLCENTPIEERPLDLKVSLTCEMKAESRFNEILDKMQSKRGFHDLWDTEDLEHVNQQQSDEEQEQEQEQEHSLAATPITHNEEQEEIDDDDDEEQDADEQKSHEEDKTDVNSLGHVQETPSKIIDSFPSTPLKRHVDDLDLAEENHSNTKRKTSIVVE